MTTQIVPTLDLGLLLATYADATTTGASVDESVVTTLANAGDETVLDVIAAAREGEDFAAARFRWVRETLEREVHRRLSERRASAGTDSEVAMSHPTIDAYNVVEFGPYQWDAEQLREAFAGLPAHETRKMLVVEPEREEYVLPLTDKQAAAIRCVVNSECAYDHLALVDIHALRTLLEKRKVPEVVKAGSTTSINAWIERHPDTPRAKMALAARTRPRIGDKTIIRPKRGAK